MAPSNKSRASRRSLSDRKRKEDRDGDTSMGAGAAAVKGRGGISKKATPTGPTAARARDQARAPAGALTSDSARRRLLAGAAANGDTRIKPPRTSRPTGLVTFRVTGYETSAASHSDDKGANAVKTWLESKVSRKLGSVATRRSVKFASSYDDDGALLVKVPAADAVVVERMNGFSWAKAKITIERKGGPVGQSDHPPSKTEETKAMLQGVLERRYDDNTKLLDLSALGQDPELRAQAIFDSKSTANKFFAAMMRVLELAFSTKQEMYAAIESVSLANNELSDLKAVSTLSTTLPHLHNLDLSNNKFENLQALDVWKRRFDHLQHLVVSNNPLEQNEPNYGAEFLKWYPKLRILNTIQVRTEEEIAKGSTVTNIPFPIRSPHFQDEGQIAETFVRTFFVGLDTDRPTLAAYYYDDNSTFSFALNTSAVRDPAGSVATEKNEWDAYIRGSRNLKKIHQLSPRQQRLIRGPKAVADLFASLPKTRHPDLGAEGRKWMIEAHIQPGIPDPTGQSPNGVDGFSITVHTEYEELDANLNAAKKRSCDHFFQIGPGPVPANVRIVSHMMTVRAYGGAQAWEPDPVEVNQACGATSPPPAGSGEPQLPPGLTIEVAEQMVVELSKQTNMTPQYSKDCLEQVGWDYQKGLAAFAEVKANLPPSAFMQVA